MPKILLLKQLVPNASNKYLGKKDPVHYQTKYACHYIVPQPLDYELLAKY